MIKIRKPYEASVRCYAPLCGETLTKQAEKDACDVNNIVRKWQKTGVIEHVAKYQGDYSDLVGAPVDYHAAFNQVLEARAAFDSLPSSVRKRFQNDPGAFLEFVSDPANGDEMIKLGLRKAPLDLSGDPGAEAPVEPSE